MADFEPPSFSLGLDFEFEPSQPQIPPVNPPPLKQNLNELEDEDEFQLHVSDSEPDSPQGSSVTRFRRLRRGGPSNPKPISRPILNSVNYDDDIEDLSDDEIARTNDLPPQRLSSCSSSKLPLSRHGVLTSQLESNSHSKKGKHDLACPSTSLGSNKGKTLLSDFTSSPLRRFQLLNSDSDPDDPSDGLLFDRKHSGVDFPKECDLARPSTSLGSSKGKTLLSDFTSSPLRRFQLLDSESDPDDPSYSLHIDQKSSGFDFPKECEEKQSSHGNHKVPLKKKTDSMPNISQKQDLWGDFYVDKSSVKTPVFDELFEEYFKTTKSRKSNPECQKGREISQPNDLGSIVPPSHRYFLHDDLRIQGLVRSRLPYFCPLNTNEDGGYKSHNASSIDYMSQFGQDGAKQKTSIQVVSSEKSSRKGRKKSKNCNVEESGLRGWINPKEATSIPKDAGRRRVHAKCQSSGRWFVSENGRKVYVTKNGKELTGQLAYRHYRKESGKGFKKPRKKTAPKKK